MTELTTLARPYAMAAFKRAKETAATAKWSENLAFLSAVMKNKEMLSAASNPKIKKSNLEKLVFDICENRLEKEEINFIKLLLQNNRLGLMPLIAKIFEELKAEDEGYVEVDVLTAYAFTKEAKEKFLKTLEKTLKKKIHMNVAIDKSLIGGVLVRAGDRVIDGSVKGQLQHLQKALQ